jgi:hypothetical protein
VTRSCGQSAAAAGARPAGARKCRGGSGQVACPVRRSRIWLPGTTEVPLAGASHHAAAIDVSRRGVRGGGQLVAWLVAERDNPHNANAVAVYLRGGYAGYLPRGAAAVLQPALVALSAVAGPGHGITQGMAAWQLRLPSARYSPELGARAGPE